jgi:hypothetical protein
MATLKAKMEVAAIVVKTGNTEVVIDPTKNYPKIYDWEQKIDGKSGKINIHGVSFRKKEGGPEPKPVKAVKVMTLQKVEGGAYIAITEGGMYWKLLNAKMHHAN